MTIGESLLFFNLARVYESHTQAEHMRYVVRLLDWDNCWASNWWQRGKSGELLCLRLLFEWQFCHLPIPSSQSHAHCVTRDKYHGWPSSLDQDTPILAFLVWIFALIATELPTTSRSLRRNSDWYTWTADPNHPQTLQRTRTSGHAKW